MSRVPQVCDYCDPSDPERSHPASNAIDGSERWWQSPPLSRGSAYNEVNVTLDLGQVSQRSDGNVIQWSEPVTLDLDQ